MLLLFLIGRASCWSGEPHEIIVNIALDMLSSQQREWFRKLFLYWPSEDQDVNMIANWQDMIQSDISKMFSQWHFNNIAFIEEGFEPTLDTPYVYNITDAIQDEIESILNPTTTSLWSLVFNFRNLFHFVGDVHCPVHSAQYYGVDYKKGDAGGNGRYTSCSDFGYNYFCTNLHKLWDSAVLNYQHNKYQAPAMPDFQKNITELRKSFPQKLLSHEISISSPYAWSLESYQTAVKFSYGMLVNGSIIDEKYLKIGTTEAKKRITLAGYRLGNLLKQFFDVRGMILFPSDPIFTSEIVAWVLDAIVFLIIIIYTTLIIISRKQKAIFNGTPLLP